MEVVEGVVGIECGAPKAGVTAGMDGYLTKPIRPQELDQILDSYLNLRSSLPEVVDAK